MTIEEVIAEAVKDAVAASVAPILARLEAMDETLRDIKEYASDLPTDDSVRQAAAESIEYSLFELNQALRDIELNRGRDELRAARAKAAS